MIIVKKKIFYSVLLLVILFSTIIFSNDPLLYTVKLKSFHEKIYSEDSTTYRLSSTNESFSLLDTDFQVIQKKLSDKGKKIIILKTGKLLNSNKKRKNNFLSKYLIDTRFLNLKSNEIKKTAAKFKNSKNIISDVEKYVCSFINNKTSGIPMLPAMDVIQTRAGDCTEHTVLSIAILRSLKIPSRAVVGMVLAEEFEGEKNIFAYHMWAEAFVGNKWCFVDSTSPGKKYLNRYIAFAYHHLQTDMPLSFLRAVSSIQDLEVTYINNSI